MYPPVTGVGIDERPWLTKSRPRLLKDCIKDAVELRPRLGASWLLVKFGPAFAVAVWLEAEQRAVITVYEEVDDGARVASLLFARLAKWTGAFEIGRSSSDEVRYRFAST